MTNRDLAATWTYHTGTKHSYTSVRSGGHYLDWKNQPLPFKIYSALEPIPLPHEFPPSTATALDAISARAALPHPTGRLFPLGPFSDQALPREPIERAILWRGSARRFSREPITFAQLSTILHRTTRGVPADFLEPVGTALNDLYLIVHAVSDLPSGAYVFRRDQTALELLKEGDFRARAGYFGLEQALPADASVDIFFLADLRQILERFGNRGYRATELEAGMVGGKLYLCSYSLGLGASGLTFDDDDVTAFFSPHADGRSAIFLVALGVPAKRHR